MTKYLIFNIIFIMLVTLSGCDMNEVEEYGIVAGIGVSYENELFEVTYEIYKENNGETTNLTSITKTAAGKTLSHAISNLSKIMYNQPYLNHCLILLLDKNIIENKFNETLNYFIHDVRIRSSCYLMITEKQTPKDLLEKSQELNYVVSYNLYKQFEHKPKIVGVWTQSNFDYILNEKINNNGVVILPTIEYDNDFDIYGAYVIKNDKDIIFASPNDIFIFQLFRNVIDEGLINLDNEFIYIKTSAASLKQKEDKITVKVKLRILTYDYINIDFDDQLQKDKYVKELETSIKKSIIDVINKYKEKNIDPFAIYRFIERKNVKKYYEIKEDYYSYFKTLDFNVLVFVDMLTTGLSEERID